MRVARVVLSFLLILSSSLLLNSQQSVATPQRDPQAVAVLTQMLTASGWGKASLPTDGIASGTVTRVSGDTQQSVAVTMKIRGPRIYRVEVRDPSGPITTIINGDAGAVTRTAGTAFLPAHSAISQRAWAFPFFSDLCALSDAAVGFQYVATETLNGNLAHRVEIIRSYSSSDPMSSLRNRVAHLTVWVSATTWLPMQIQFNRVSDDNPTAIRSLVRTFSDYRVVNGLAIPFRQEQFAAGQLLQKLQLTSVSFNTGLPDSEFALPAAQN
jgi:outer membrane lipoprotein-sorting protein